MSPRSLIASAIILALVSGAGYGAWRLLRRPPRVGAPAGSVMENPLFQVSHLGRGELIELQPQVLTPLRTVRWLRPFPGGYALAQVLTQSDRQMVALFKDGQLDRMVAVPQPAAASLAFFRMAELRDAALAPDDHLVLLYRGGGSEAALVADLDLKAGSILWAHRAEGEHLALGQSSIFIWGAWSPVLAMPITLRKSEDRDAPKGRAGLKALEMPQGLGEATDLIPTGSGFLLAHRNGLAAYANGAWTQQPLPPGDPMLSFPGIPGILANAGKDHYWQPAPGQLAQVKADGSVLHMLDLAKGLPEAQVHDASLLRLRGADAEGGLWFDLAMPQLAVTPAMPVASPAVSPAPSPTPNPAVSPAVSPAPSLEPSPVPAPTLAAPALPIEPPLDPRGDWENYLKGGLDRMYRWKDGSLAPVDVASRWPRLGAPPVILAPGGMDLHPEAGGLLLGTDARRWWLPLEALTR